MYVEMFKIAIVILGKLLAWPFTFGMIAVRKFQRERISTALTVAMCAAGAGMAVLVLGVLTLLGHGPLQQEALAYTAVVAAYIVLGTLCIYTLLSHAAPRDT